jgi:putative hydrolase of the HAD superfamily
MNSKFKAVGFDYGGVVYGKPGSYFDARVSQLLDMTVEEFRQEYLRVNYKVNNGILSKDVFWEEFLKDLGKSEKYDECETLIRSIQNEKTINNEILELVDTLKNNGYKVGLLSNNSLDARKKFEAHGILDRFDVTIISAEVGLSKPESKIFELFVSQLGVTPQELVLIDDSEHSLSTAREVGFTPLLFTDQEKLLEDLKNLEVI